MMKTVTTLSFASIKKVLWLMMVGIVSLVLLTQSTVQAQSATMANQELTDKLASMRTELNRRLTSSQQALDALKTVDSTDSVKKIEATLTKSIDAIKKLVTELDSVKDIKSAGDLAVRIEKQYDQYASANASAYAMNDTSEQKAALDKMTGLANDSQSAIDQAGAQGADMGGQQDMMKTIKQLIDTIVKIIASVIALIIAIATGQSSFSDIQPALQTIVGQLAQNITSMSTIQGMFGTIITSIGGSGLKINTSPSYDTPVTDQ